MERRGSPEDDGARPARPPLREVVWWILRPSSAHDVSAESLRGAAEDAYARLRGRLAVSLGELGFDALWGRALQLALRQVGLDEDPVELPAPAGGGSGLAKLGGQRHVQALHDLLHAAFACFFGLLATFISEDLCFSIIHQLWPELPLGETDPSAKEHNYD
jgi:hypothetical protein